MMLFTFKSLIVLPPGTLEKLPDEDRPMFWLRDNNGHQLLPTFSSTGWGMVSELNFGVGPGLGTEQVLTSLGPAFLQVVMEGALPEG